MPLLSLSNNKFRSQLSEWASVDIGGKTNQFKPTLLFNKWQDECQIELSLQVAGNFSPSVSNDSITCENSALGFQFNPTPVKNPFNDAGGFDWKIVLKKKPSVNYLSFGFNPTLVTAFHQPALTAQEIVEGSQRPDYVVNSIAFYHSTRQPFHAGKATAEKYRAGKVGHLYTPQAIDANGLTVWCAWSLLPGNEIRLEVDQAFLNVAKYPVTIQPVGDTFGYVSVGASSIGFTRNSTDTAGMSSQRTAVSGDTLTSFSIYGSLDSGTDTNLIMAAYTVTAGVPDARLAIGVSVGTLTTTAQWYTSATVSQAMVAGSIYCVAEATWNIAVGRTFTVSYDAGVPPGRLVKSSGGGLVDPFGTVGTDSGRHYSWYATYTPGSGGWANIAKVNGVASASISKVNGVAKASIAKISGVAV